MHKLKDCTMKYEYMLYTWGGFYNEEFKKIHQKEDGEFYFKSSEDRDKYLSELIDISIKLNAHCLMYKKAEGYDLNNKVTLHRVIIYKGVEYYSNRVMGRRYDYESSLYFIKNKWLPGFNDYPLGDDFDYEGNSDEITIKQEWVTGSFDMTTIT